MKINSTTRLYPRSVTEAFKKTVEYSAAIEIPNRKSKILWYCFGALFAIYAMIVSYFIL